MNGLALENGVPKYVTALAETDVADGWRLNKATSGCLIDVDSGQTIVRGLSMPHSPVARDNTVLFLNSGFGSLSVIDCQAARADELARFPGYTRGLAVHRNLAVIGLSKIRESSTFGGLPISQGRSKLKCGVAIVDLATGKLVGQFEFKTGVEEIFDVAIVPARSVALRGPYSAEDGHEDIWLLEQ